jgi:hypothetical protein
MKIEITNIQINQNGFIILNDVKYEFSIIDKSITWDIEPIGDLLEIEKNILSKEDWRIGWFKHIYSNFESNI